LKLNSTDAQLGNVCFQDAFIWATRHVGQDRLKVREGNEVCQDECGDPVQAADGEAEVEEEGVRI
jgi:hypothetical protein